MPETSPSSEQLEDLFALSIDLMAIAAGEQLLKVNPAWTASLGWTAEELVSQPLTNLVHPDDKADTGAMLEAPGDGIHQMRFRTRIRDKDGRHHTFHMSICHQRDSVYLIARDSALSTDLRERAERSEAVATGIFRTAVDPIIVIDIHGLIADANKATSELFGYRRDELLGRNIKMLMPEPYRSEHDGYLERYLAEGEPRIIGIGREVEAQRADGSVFPMALAVSEVITGTDHLFTGMVHDLTERNRQRDRLQAINTQLESRVAERTSQLETLLDELRRSNRDLEQFAYIASHDLQAPLRNVRQGLELLDEHLEETVGSSFDDEAQELRDLVVAAVLRMEELIKGLLAYSRVQLSPADQREHLEMDDVVGDVVAMLAPDVINVGGTITVDKLPALTGDPVQLRQVFQNLIENAIRYRSNDRPLTIHIMARESTESQVVLAVTDNGSGIEEAHHERIFELFRRGHSGYEGMGLGLAICQRIVEGHKGRIWIESQPDAGATFYLAFPL